MHDHTKEMVFIRREKRKMILIPKKREKIEFHEKESIPYKKQQYYC